MAFSLWCERVFRRGAPSGMCSQHLEEALRLRKAGSLCLLNPCWNCRWTRRDTSPLRADARENVARKQFVLRGIKVISLATQSREFSDGKSFDQQHGRQALWTRTARRLGGSAGRNRLPLLGE